MAEIASEGVGDVFAGLITRAELLRQFGIHDVTLRRWHRSGIGPPRIRIGAQEYYRVEAVRDWLVSHEKNGARAMK